MTCMISILGRAALFAGCVGALGARPASAQGTCPCPPTPGPGWGGSAGAGLALNGGNSDTRSFNLSADLFYDPQKRNVFKLSGLYLSSDSNGARTVEKSALGLRDEIKLGTRWFAFAEVGYQRDRFRNLDRLLAPGAGIGYDLVKTDRVTLTTEAGLALAIEKLTDQPGTEKGALRAGQRLSWKVSPAVTMGQAFGALWKFQDFADAYYRLEGNVTAAVARRLQLRVAYIADLKNKPANQALKKRDNTFLTTLVFKIRPS